MQNPKKQISQTAAYKLKLGTIQNSIYGVDIQPMAVELSRLWSRIFRTTTEVWLWKMLNDRFL